MEIEATTQTVDQTTTDPSTETKETTTTQTETENKQIAKPTVPFHEDPKVQDYINRQVDTRLATERETIEKNIAQRLAPKSDIKVPHWFGGDEEAYKAFLADQSKRDEDVRASTIKELKSQKEAEDTAIKNATDWFEENVKEIESKGEKVDRNLLLKTAMDEELIDSKGRWNYKAAYKILKGNTKPAVDDTNGDRKEFAAATTSNDKTEPKTTTAKSSKDFKGKNWSTL